MRMLRYRLTLDFLLPDEGHGTPSKEVWAGLHEALRIAHDQDPHAEWVKLTIEEDPPIDKEGP